MKSILLILSIFLGGNCFASTLHPLDSIGVKEVNGKIFILHKVEKGEGLYAIARRYKASVDEIKTANPETADGLKVGQIILVPTKMKATTLNAPGINKDTEPGTGPRITHLVEPGETLYSISKIYNVSVEQIKLKNNLTSNNLTVGQELIIKGEFKVVEHVEKYGAEEKTEFRPKAIPTIPVVVPDKQNTYEYISATGEVKESGFAVVAFNENMNQERSFCLHPTAPTGTIIMVTNVSTNKSVFVRVVGKPEDMESQVIIKLSKAAGVRLGVGENDQAMVRLNYAK